jgi:hypothetical protein
VKEKYDTSQQQSETTGQAQPTNPHFSHSKRPSPHMSLRRRRRILRSIPALILLVLLPLVDIARVHNAKALDHAQSCALIDPPSATPRRPAIAAVLVAEERNREVVVRVLCPLRRHAHDGGAAVWDLLAAVSELEFLVDFDGAFAEVGLVDSDVESEGCGCHEAGEEGCGAHVCGGAVCLRGG